MNFAILARLLSALPSLISIFQESAKTAQLIMPDAPGAQKMNAAAGAVVSGMQMAGATVAEAQELAQHVTAGIQTVVDNYKNHSDGVPANPNTAMTFEKIAQSTAVVTSILNQPTGD